MATDVPIAPIYNSVFRHGVDEKRRVQIPSMWREKDAKVQFTLIVWPQRSERPCLRVLPPKEMAELMASLDAMPNDDRNKTVLKRIIGAESTQVALDGGGKNLRAGGDGEGGEHQERGGAGGLARPFRGLGSGAI